MPEDGAAGAQGAGGQSVAWFWGFGVVDKAGLELVGQKRWVAQGGRGSLQQ